MVWCPSRSLSTSCCCFETGSNYVVSPGCLGMHYAVHVGLRLTQILLPPAPKCRYERHTSPFPEICLIIFETKSPIEPCSYQAPRMYLSLPFPCTLLHLAFSCACVGDQASVFMAVWPVYQQALLPASIVSIETNYPYMVHVGLKFTMQPRLTSNPQSFCLHFQELPVNLTSSTN